jgi:hypothetical protein
MKQFDKHSRARPLTWLMAALLAVLVAGCGGGSSAPAPGTLGVSLTDAPACGYDAVNVTVNKVRVHQSASAPDTAVGWTDITLNPPRKINLLSLNNGVLDSLGETPLAAGQYTQLRLVLDPNTGNSLANSVVPTGGVETALVTPSAIQSGIKLINQFNVVSGQRVDLVLDFDACKSIVLNGAGVYMLKPVIRISPFALNGIDGFVDPALLPNGNVLVTAQQGGVVAQTTAPNTTTGEFFLARVMPGNYDVVITADGRATAIIATVPVTTSTSVVNISTSGVPITLPLSATHTISGTVALNPVSSTAVAYTMAQQAVSTLPVVTVKSQAADLSSGAYSLNLPIGAPQFATYGALPITFANGTYTVGQYTDAASATGYTTQSIMVDISAANFMQNFTLIP